MIDKIYYDSFADEYVAYTDAYAPPERYLPTYRGNEKYVEIWRDKDGELHDVIYTQTNFDDGSDLQILKEAINTHELRERVRWTIPAAKFDEYVKEFGLE